MMRFTPFTGIILGLALGLGLLSTTTAAARTLSAADVANRKAAIIAAAHKKARKALVNAAQDPAFGELAKSGLDHKDHSAHHRADEISLRVQSQFNIEEMCLIAPDGTELSRIVGRKIATDLSKDETGAVFFEPSFATPPRKTYTSPPYISADVHKWVIAYVTPIVADKRTVAILHFERGLNVYQDLLNKGVAPETVVLAVSGEGWIVSDSREDIGIKQKNESEDPSRYFSRFAFNGMDLAQLRSALDSKQPIVGDDGTSYTAAYKAVDDWTVVVFIPQG